MAMIKLLSSKPILARSFSTSSSIIDLQSIFSQCANPKSSPDHLQQDSKQFLQAFHRSMKNDVIQFLASNRDNLQASLLKYEKIANASNDVTVASTPQYSKTSSPPNHTPKKESLLAIDWILEGLTPQFMKTRLQPIFEKFDPDVEYVDEIFGYNAKGVSQLGMNITKIRAWFRWKSPYNKVAHKGSYLFEDENYVVLLWGLETMDSSFIAYFPSFITGRKTPVRYLEGALQFTVSTSGKITKIVNRKITEKDIQFAEKFAELKKSENARFDKEDRKAAEAEMKEKIERQEQ